MKILNLYAGIGGNRKLWGDEHEVTSIELNPEIAEVYKKYFPNDTIIVADAHEYLLKHYEEFDFIWSSPPCQTHTRINKNFGFIRYADMKLYQEIILLKTWFKGLYCVENVIPYYGLLIPAQQHHRHMFWCNFKIKTTSKANPPKQIPIKAQNGNYEKSFIDNDNVKDLCEMLGFEYYSDKNIYIGKNHSPGQMFRNAVNPKIGLMILNCALNKIDYESIKQGELF